MTELKCKCGASIPADSQFCPECGKKIEDRLSNSTDPNKWTDVAIHDNQKKHFFRKFFIYCIIGAIISLFLGLYGDGEFNDHNDIWDDKVFIPFYYAASILLIIGLYSLNLSKKYIRNISNLTHIENNSNSSILIGKDYFGKVGLYKLGIFKATQLLPNKFNKIEHIGDNLYKLEENGNVSIYNTLTKELTCKLNN